MAEDVPQRQEVDRLTPEPQAHPRTGGRSFLREGLVTGFFVLFLNCSLRLRIVRVL
jgi:hypothetical protein